ncbi:MAG TPA: ubiquitin-like domain-containing protein [Patescibacteria group bacterium]|nr:ubiquitin-like domain-containing protein [Patescibacteria group bacterium]
MHLFRKRLKKSAASKEAKQDRPLRRFSRHPAFTIPLLTGFFVMFVTIMGVVIFNGGGSKLRATDTHIVIISHDKKEQVVPTRATTVKEVLDKSNVQVRQGDVVEPALSAKIDTDNFRINVYRAVPVTIVDGGHKTFTYSAATTPRSIVKQAGIQVYPEDNLELLPTDNFLTEGSIGQRVVIERATPVNVNVYGTAVQMRTRSTTVGALMTERGLKLEPSDTLQPTASTPITANMQIFLLRKGTKIITEEQAIPMPVETVDDSSLTFGTTAIRQQGSDGKKLITYQVETQNNVEVSRKQIQEVVTVQPVTQINARGKAVEIPSDKQAVMAAAGISSGDYAYVDYIISHESGWCPTKLQGQAGYCPPYAPSSIPSGLGYGLGQATPGSKMASFGADWQTSAVTQLRWATSYADARFGSWGAAYNYWTEHHNW